jgi:hypothetical protein
MAQAAASDTEKGELEMWTFAAAQAAEQGQWDRVEECYQEREAAMSRIVLSQDQIEGLLAVDRRIQAQALVAKMALAEQLRQSFSTRMRLKGLRSVVGESEGDSGAFRMKA